MREIEFRGKETASGDWVYGHYYTGLAGEANIVDGMLESHEVEPETIGQKTGLKNRDGQDIYEGDILSFVDLSDRRSLLLVEWSQENAAFIIGWVRTDYALRGKVVGNIHDNPELLRG